MTENDIRKVLSEMRNEPVPSESLRRVQLAVAERIQPRPRIWWWWAPAAFAAAACAIVLMFWMRTSIRPATPREAAPVRAAANPPQTLVRAQPPLVRSRPPQPQPQPAPVRTVSRPRRSAEKPAAPASNIVIRIETPDPDVVILLIGD
jgi:hypothetical protein